MYNQNRTKKDCFSVLHIKFVVLSLLFLPFCQAQEPTCYVCGSADLRVGNTDAEVQFPGRNTTDNCGDIQEGGLQGFIPEGFCSLIPDLISNCECEAGDSTKRPSAAPVLSGGAPVAASDTTAPAIVVALPPTPIPTQMPTPDPTLQPVTMSPTLVPTAEPTTMTPTVNPTTAPITSKPTREPSVFPTWSPSDAPTSAPTPQPTTGAPVTVPTTPAPTPNPTVDPTVAPSEAPVFYTVFPTMTPTTFTPTIPVTTGSPVVEPTTPAPTQEPTLAPITEAPTQTTSSPTPEPETEQPSPKPTTTSPVTTTEAPITAQPVTPPVTRAPVVAPTTSAPVDTTTEAPMSITDAPSESVPSGAPPNLPPLVGPEVLSGLQMILVGVTGAPLSSQEIAEWQDVTSSYVRSFFADNPALGVSDVTSTFQVTSQNAVRRRRRRRLLGGRQLQQEQVVLTYDQTVRYRSTDSSVTPEFVAEQPFLFIVRRIEYNRQLRNSGDPAFEQLELSSDVRFPNDNNVNSSERSTDDSGGLPMGIIIGIAVGGAVAVVLFVGGGLYLNRRQKNSGQPLKDIPPMTVSASNGGDDEVSRLDDPSKVGPVGDISVGYGDQSVATVDYDYSKAYGGAADHSVSSAGGTFGSNIHTGGNQSATGSDPYGTGPPTLGSFDDESYGDSAYRESAMAGPEVLMDIYAPPGKLGVVIDTPDDGAPVVHAVKETSVIAGKLQVGDKLVAVDDEDVRNMTAIKVSKLISRKSANATRKLSIIRSTL